jgi:hypothetical protein
MSTVAQTHHTSRVRFAVRRVDITPPPNIYHPMWGAARHFRATGIHRPLYADIMAFAPADEDGEPWIQLQLDMVGLAFVEHHALLDAVTAATDLPQTQLVLAYSHTHSGGLFSPDRVDLPGGELIAPYLAKLNGSLGAAASSALGDLQPAVITYAYGHCALAANRDYWDDANHLYACGFNPDAPADDTLLVGRVTGPGDELLALIVNYACHPTTLAWENTLISPDYVGALRATVEAHLPDDVPCVFTLGACGDLGPRHSHVGDTGVADRNGQMLGFAALATFTTMDPPATRFEYQGPVVSGATLGTWQHKPFTPEIEQLASRFDGLSTTVDLPLKQLPSTVELEREMDVWLDRQQKADAAGDAIAARDFGARAERARRWRSRIQHLPEGSTYPYRYSVRQMGSTVWVAVSGEPYNWLQTELRRRFPDRAVVVTALASHLGVVYLLPAERYGVGLYQEEPSILEQGCLELVADAVTTQIRSLDAK